jgi:hypothetical protein
MSGQKRRFQLCLLPVNEDGTISDIPSAGSSPAPQASPDQPLDVSGARLVLLSEVGALEALDERLGHLCRVVPVPARRDAMYDGRLPLNVAANMPAAIDFVLRDYVRPAIEHLSWATTVTDEELRRNFEELQRKVEASVGGEHGEHEERSGGSTFEERKARPARRLREGGS